MRKHALEVDPDVLRQGVAVLTHVLIDVEMQRALMPTATSAPLIGSRHDGALLGVVKAGWTGLTRQARHALQHQQSLTALSTRAFCVASGTHEDLLDRL